MKMKRRHDFLDVFFFACLGMKLNLSQRKETCKCKCGSSIFLNVPVMKGREDVGGVRACCFW